MSFTKSIVKNLSNRYRQKLLDSAKKSTMEAIKTASKRAIQRPAEATGNLIGNKIADNLVLSVSTELHSKKSLKNYKMTKWKHQKKDTYLQKKEKKV